MVKPITPKKADKLLNIPDVVFETFNALIWENYTGRSATFSQSDVMARLHNAGLRKIFERGWLNIEPHYRAVGWKVTYEKPEPGEGGGRAMFTFEKKSYRK